MERSRVFLIRHGQVNGYEDIPVYGHTDVALTETGKLQMQHMADRLRFVDLKAIYSSNLSRAVWGARQIARYHDVPLYPLAELREMYFGDWEGLILSDIRNRFPEELEKREADILDYHAPGGGESLAAFSKRITACFEGIQAKHNADDIAIVAHGGVNRVILSNALGLDIKHMFRIHQEYGCLNIIDFFSDTNLVQLMNG